MTLEHDRKGISIAVSAEVQAALAAGQPVVALESTVISHGLPYPHNLELALAMEQEVRDQGAVPATVGIVAGVPTVGMDAAAIRRFAHPDPHHPPLKVSRRDIGYVSRQAAMERQLSRQRWRLRIWRVCRYSQPAGLAAFIGVRARHGMFPPT